MFLESVQLERPGEGRVWNKVVKVVQIRRHVNYFGPFCRFHFLFRKAHYLGYVYIRNIIKLFSCAC